MKVITLLLSLAFSFNVFSGNIGFLVAYDADGEEITSIPQFKDRFRCEETDLPEERCIMAHARFMDEAENGVISCETEFEGIQCQSFLIDQLNELKIEGAEHIAFLPVFMLESDRAKIEVRPFIDNNKLNQAAVRNFRSPAVIGPIKNEIEVEIRSEVSR